MAPETDDGPETDGCEMDFVDEADDELTASLRPLFPDGTADPAKVAAYEAMREVTP